MAATKQYYYIDKSVFILQFSTPAGSDGRYIGVWFSVTIAPESREAFSKDYPFNFRVVIDGRQYVSCLRGGGLTTMISLKDDDPAKIGNPLNPQDYKKTITLTSFAYFGGESTEWVEGISNIKNTDGTTPDAITYTFTPALLASATGELIDHYPWSFRWSTNPEDCTPYRHTGYDPAARNRYRRLPDCQWQAGIKWLNANGTPFILPFSIEGAETTAKMQDGGAYDGDDVIILRSPALTSEEMKYAATIGESLKIAVVFQRAQGAAYPALTWVWAAVEDITITDMADAQSQTIEIHVIR